MSTRSARGGSKKICREGPAEDEGNNSKNNYFSEDIKYNLLKKRGISEILIHFETKVTFVIKIVKDQKDVYQISSSKKLIFKNRYYIFHF
jgi:hypothetical protein